MSIIENKTFGEERALYNSIDTKVVNCKFDGEEDGESALKESRNLTVDSCYFNLRYPLWHVNGFTLENIEMTENCRAPIWYSERGAISNSKLNGLKALRECSDIAIVNSVVDSKEFGWNCKKISLIDSTINSEYIFMGCKDLTLKKVHQTGKYSFQYVKNSIIEDSVLDTKDAFWHTKNVVVINSIVKGEYLGWYSENLTLIGCKITGTQPLCYCKRLKLINCTMEGCDLAFEYSDVKATINSDLVSIKNPRKGKIEVNGHCDVIRDHTVIDCKGNVIFKENN